MNLPVNLSAAQADRLNALLVKGAPELVVIDDVVNGSPLYVVLARGEARKYVQAAIENTSVDAIEAADLQDAAIIEPPVKVVAVRDGVNAAQPGTRRPN